MLLAKDVKNIKCVTFILAFSPNSCFLIHHSSVPDELVYEVKSHLVNQATVIVRDCTTKVFRLKFPLTVKIKTLPSWKNLNSYLT